MPGFSFDTSNKHALQTVGVEYFTLRIEVRIVERCRRSNREMTTKYLQEEQNK